MGFGPTKNTPAAYGSGPRPYMPERVTDGPPNREPQPLYQPVAGLCSEPRHCSGSLAMSRWLAGHVLDRRL